MKNQICHLFSKMVLLFILSTTTASLSSAQEVGVKVDNIKTSEDTTITIKKGSDSNTINKKKWVITEGEDEITGEKDLLQKNAEKKWKTACTEWKKEFKEMNKDNKIMNMSCGKMNCTKEGVETTCSSMAKHKMRVVEEE